MTPIHYAFPALVFFYFLIAYVVSVCTLQTKLNNALNQRINRGAILALTLAATGTYVSSLRLIESIDAFLSKSAL